MSDKNDRGYDIFIDQPQEIGQDEAPTTAPGPDDPRQNSESSRAESPKRPQYRFNLIRFDQIKRRQTSTYLIKGLIPRNGLVVVWGPPKCGKSFWVFDAVMHIALGWEYRGRRVTAGSVVYLALEGQDGFADRVDAFRQRRLEGDEVPSFFLVKERTDLIRDHAELIKCIRSQCDGPSAVVIDTMNRSLVGSESKDEDMAAYIKAADAIKETFDCAVIIIHHCGIDGTRPRGHTSLTGAADVQISVKRTADNVTAEVEFAKDMPEGAVISSRLEVIELGADQDGDQMTSRVVVPASSAENPEPKTKAKLAISKAAKIALRALNEALADDGKIIISSYAPDNTKAVSEEMWRKYAYKRGISVGADRAKQKAFKAATQSLLTSAVVATWDDQYWVVRDDVS
jgi:hypothetical protein